MSEKKSITIDSNSLLGGGSSSSKRKSNKRSNGSGSGSGERKIRPSSIVQPSTLKKTLLERIKQHQRTRERSRAETESQSHSHSESEPISGGGGRSGDSSGGGGAITDNFSQSIDFLRKLAMKRRQLTQKNHRPSAAASLSSSANTPEAQILNTIAPTLQHGEILTNTGLLGLPVVPTLVTEKPSTAISSMSIPHVGPSISVGPMPMPMPTMMPIPPEYSSEPIKSEIPPKITDLAEMYNNTIAAATPETTSSSTTNDNITDSSKEPPLHIPQKPEDYLPSIFIKEEPPHGCLKNGKKPTFREWATKIFGGGPPGGPSPHDGGAIGGAMSGGSGGAMGGGSGGGSGGAMSGGSGGEMSGGSGGDIDPSQIAGMRVKIRKTHKKRYRIGKHDNVVGVLLKNKQTQRHIQSQHLKLRQSSIGEIRKYLYDHHLLKIGSNAPPDVLRRMYEDAILTGDVKNTNDGVMLHNFMSGGGGE